MTIDNSGNADDRLPAIEGGLKVQMPVSKIVDGVASMKKMADGFSVPAGAAVGLGENGMHAMFMGPIRQLKAGEKIAAALVLEKAGRVNVVFNVEERSAETNESHDSH